MERDDAAAAKKPAVWDCGSLLYDSFELESFKRQLDAAIASRSYSMPRLSDPEPPPRRTPKKPSRISRSIHRLLQTVFRVGGAGTAVPPHGCNTGQMGRGYHGVYPHCGALGLIPEASVKGVGSPDQLGPAMRKTKSERLTVAVARVSCH